MRLLLIVALMASLFCTVVGVDHALNDRVFPHQRIRGNQYQAYMEHIRHIAYDLAYPIVLPAAVFLVCVALLLPRAGERPVQKRRLRSAWAMPDE